MYRVMTDLARPRGFGRFTSDWRTALNTLLDNNLLPPRIAEAILNVIEDLEDNIRLLDNTSLELPETALPEDLENEEETNYPE
jgi:hypothetical protein